MEGGKFSEPIIDKLNAVDAELKALSARRGELEPVEVELSEDIPALYRAYIENLLATLSEETIAGRASDELHGMIETVIVEWDAKISKRDAAALCGAA